MFKNFNIKNPQASTYLLAFAIFIEIGVAALAVYLGLMTSSIGSNEVDVTILNKTMGPLLFIVVAMIELTRVPLLISIYRGNNFLWRIFGSIFLIGIMFLAFETLMTAFQMNGAMQTGNIDKTIIDKRALTEKSKILNEEILDLSSLTQEKINNDYDEAIKRINQEEDKEISNINDSMQQIELLIAQSSIDSISDKESILNDELLNIDEIRNSQINEIKGSFRNKEDKIINQISKIETNIILWNTRLNNSECGFARQFSSRECKESITSNEEELDNLNKELVRNEDTLQREIDSINLDFKEDKNAINNELKLLADKKIQDESNIKGEYALDLNKLRENKSDIYDKYSERKKEVLSKKNEKEIKLDNAEKALETKKNEKINLEKEISDKRDKINQLSRTNPNYILAKNIGSWIFDDCEGVEESSDVSSGCLAKTTGLFWGSISLVVAITGTVVAIGSEVLRSTTIRERKSPKGKRSMRYLLVGAYKYFRKPKVIVKEIEKIVEKPVEVVKEVPVQKVEFTEVPKIKEVIKKEIVHVPLYTNDESLIDINKNKKNKNESD